MKTIKININDPYPSSTEYYYHELNEGGTRKILVSFYDESAPLDLTNATITATIVCNKMLVAEGIAQSLKSGTTNQIEFDVTSTSNYTIHSGEMLVEFKFTTSNGVLLPVVAMIVNIAPSIMNDAQVTPQSYGTVSEILQEVAEARGKFQNLNARLNDINDKALSSEVGSSRLSQELSQNISTLNYNMGQAQAAVVRINGEIDNLNLSVDILNENSVIYTETAVPTLSVLNSRDFLDPKIICVLKLGGTAYSELGRMSLVARMIVTPQNITGGTKYIREIYFPNVEGIKFVQEVLPSGGSWTYGNWVEKEIDYDTIPKIDNPTYCFSFDVNYNLLGKIITTTIGLGSFAGAQVKKIYASSDVTSISKEIKTISCPNLNVLMIDNFAGNVDIAQELLDDTNLTILYRGEFNLGDILFSALYSLTRTVGTVNTMLENAVNGVS